MQFKIKFFQKLKFEQIVRLCHCTQYETYSKDRQLYRAGEKVLNIYVVLSGQLQVTSNSPRSQQTSYLNPGDVVNEDESFASYQEGMVRKSSAVCKTACEILLIARGRVAS